MGRDEPPEDREILLDSVLEGFLRAEDLLEELPRRVGRYEVVRALGEGGTSRVLLARDPEIGRMVAIKFLVRTKGSLLERFRREMKVLASLRHPNVVAIHDAGSCSGVPYFVMEFVAGRSLEEDMPSSPREAVEILEKVAMACEAAHALGILHLDLKPANILLGREPIVADFGLAKVLGELDSETRPDMVMGTPFYMAPEQMEGRRDDPRSDVYALGAILFRCLAGRLPHEATSYPELVRKKTMEDPTPLRSIDPTIPAELEAIAGRALQRDPERRFQSARDFSGALRRWLDGGIPVAASRRRSRRWILAAAAGAVALLGSGVWRLAGPGEPAEDPLERIGAAIESWEAGPVPTGADSHLVLVQAIEELSGDPDVGSSDPGRAFLLRARARAHCGDEEGARSDLSLAIGRGGPVAAEARFLRAWLTWPRLLRLSASGNDELEACRASVLADLEGSLSGVSSPPYGPLATVLIGGIRGGSGAGDPALEALAPDIAAYARGSFELLAARWAEANGAFASAPARARTCVRLHLASALSRWRLHLESGKRRLSLDTAFHDVASAIAACPDEEESYAVLCILFRQVLLRPGLVPDVPVSLADRTRLGVQRRPESPAVRVAHGFAALRKAYQRILDEGLDDPPELAEAISSFDRARQIDPGAFLAAGGLLFAESLRAFARGERASDDPRVLARTLEVVELAPAGVDRDRISELVEWIDRQR